MGESGERIEFTKVDLAVIDFRPGDVAVLMWPRKLNANDMHYVLDVWRQNYPDIKCMVLDDGARLGVIRAVPSGIPRPAVIPALPNDNALMRQPESR